MIRTAVQNREIRYYEAGDAPEIVRLFFETVRSVNRADYSDEQLEAWAPSVPDPEEWHARMAGRRTLVAEEGGEVVGFAELEYDGRLDMLYVRKDAVGRGVAAGGSTRRSSRRPEAKVSAGSSPRRASPHARSSSSKASA
jgi:putative acetyltransferase